MLGFIAIPKLLLDLFLILTRFL